MALANYMWGQSGELDETGYGDCVHPGAWLPCFNMSVSPPINSFEQQAEHIVTHCMYSTVFTTLG